MFVLSKSPTFKYKVKVKHRAVERGARCATPRAGRPAGARQCLARCSLLRPGKKLAEAAAYWAGGGKHDEGAREDLKSFGADAAQIEKALGPKEEHFEIWPDNWPAWQAFVSVQTQWSTGFGGPTGLDYSRVKAGLEMAGIEMTKEMFAHLRIIEAAALKAMSKKDPA
jgi:hypothetical protein